MNNNNNLTQAKKNKNDEFYTQLSDINNELQHYTEHFKDKVVYCNCDNPNSSNFTKYFLDNFKSLELKQLISTYYDSSNRVFGIICNGEIDINGLLVIETYELQENGDFRSPECVEILKEADIVVTNPPFSLFREYVAQLVEFDKKFIVIGNYNSVTYKEIFSLIKQNKLWIGISPRSMNFKEPGGKITSVNASWFTNLNHKKRNEELILYKKYNSNDYQKYDNYDAINIDKTKDIPIDFKGAMGVPITFLEKFNPNQFEILGDSRYITGECDDINCIDGKLLYKRIIIKHKIKNKGE